MTCITLNQRVAGSMVMLFDASSEVEHKKQNLELFRAMLDDVSAPLDQVKGIIAGLQNARAPAPEETRILFEQLFEGCNRFKDFAGVLFGEQRTERIPFQPGRLVALVRKSLRPFARQRGVILEEGMARELPAVLGDPALVNRVLGLIVDYMVRSVPKNEMVVVSSELLLTNEGVPWLAYAVTGTGFSSREAEFLEAGSKKLESFAQLPDEMKRLVLRLFLARRLVQAMTGVVSVAAHEHAGTTISIRMPVEIQFGAGE